MAETNFDEFKGKDCEFVAVWLKTKGLHKLCSVFEVVTLVMMLVVLTTVPNSTGSVSHEGVEVVDGSDDDCEFDEDMEPLGNSSQSITELLRCRKPSTIREAWLLGFYDFLQTLSGKALSPKYAEQHTCQIHLMLQRINPDHDSLDCLVNQQASAVWKWAKPLLDSRQKRPGTIISYQTSLEKFYKFARDKQYYTNDNFILSPPTLQQIIRNSEQMTSWRQW